MFKFSSLVAGRKTYLAAAGLAVLGIIEMCLGEIPQGLQALLAAMTAAGLRGAMNQPTT